MVKSEHNLLHALAHPPKHQVSLTEGQIGSLATFLLAHSERPSSDTDLKQQRAFEKCKPPTPKPKKIANTVRGFESNEVVPLHAFQPRTDLPAGWAIVPCWDSGNNHKVESALTYTFREIWNCWGCYQYEYYAAVATFHEWAANIAANLEGTELLPQLRDACDELKLDFVEVETRYLHWQGEATVCAIYFILTGYAYPTREGYTWH